MSCNAITLVLSPLLLLLLQLLLPYNGTPAIGTAAAAGGTSTPTGTPAVDCEWWLLLLPPSGVAAAVSALHLPVTLLCC